MASFDWQENIHGRNGVFTTIEYLKLFCLFEFFSIWIFRTNIHMVVHSFCPFAAMDAWLVQYHPEMRSLVLHTCIFFRKASFVTLGITDSAFVWTLNQSILRLFENELNWISKKNGAESIEIKPYLW